MSLIHNRIYLYQNTPFDRRGVDVCAEWTRLQNYTNGIVNFLEPYKLIMKGTPQDVALTPEHWGADGGYNSIHAFNPAEKKLYVRFQIPADYVDKGDGKGVEWDSHGAFQRMESVNYIAVFPVPKGYRPEWSVWGLTHYKPYFFFARLANIVQADYEDAPLGDTAPVGADCFYWYTAEYDIDLDLWNTEVCGFGNKAYNSYISGGIVNQCHLNDCLFPTKYNEFDAGGTQYKINENAAPIPARTKTAPTAGTSSSGTAFFSNDENIFAPARIDAFYYDDEAVPKEFKVLFMAQISSPETGYSVIQTCVSDRYPAPNAQSTARNIRYVIQIIQNLTELRNMAEGAEFKYNVQVMTACLIPTSWEHAYGDALPTTTTGQNGYYYVAPITKEKTYFHVLKDADFRIQIETKKAIRNAKKTLPYWYGKPLTETCGALNITLGTRNNRYTIPQKVEELLTYGRGTAEDAARYNTAIAYLQIVTAQKGGFEIALILPNGSRETITQDFLIPLFSTETTAQQTQREIEHNLRKVSGGTQLIGGLAATVGGIASANPMAAVYGVSSIAGAVGALQSNAAEIPPTPTARGGGGNGELNAFNEDGAIYFEIQLAENYQTIVDEVTRYGFFVGGKAFHGKAEIFKFGTNTKIRYNYIEMTEAEFSGEILTETAKEYLRDRLARGLRVWYYAADYKDREAKYT